MMNSRLPLLAFLAFTSLSMTQAADLYSIPLKDLTGEPASLEPYRGKVMLIVNVASRCGNTKQYTQLQELHEKYGPEGLAVLGFPCNQFGRQEPGTNDEIAEFCSSKYGVTFPMFDKLEVKGENQHPLYQQLSGAASPFPGDVKWNFGKFVVGRDGEIIARFDPRTKPDAPEVIAALEKALAEPAN